MTGIELIDRAQRFAARDAVLAGNRPYTYAALLDASAAVAGHLLETAGGRGQDPDARRDLREARVAFLLPGSFEYAAVQWGVWRAGGVAVPLGVGATGAELEYTLADADVCAVVAADALLGRTAPPCEKLGIPLISTSNLLQQPRGDPTLPVIEPGRRAMMLYTSGTTSRPKGVVSTHANIRAQILSLVEAWGWGADDRIPLFLPLHHVHGIVNVLSCALWSGALVETFPSFDLERILARVGEKAYTMFMAVPTIYVNLIRAFGEATERKRKKWIEGFRAMRLMVSGSAALPASVHETWTELTGQQLLERYGMTEIGMGLSNPLHGERRPGAVGHPLPGMQVRLVDDTGHVIGGDAMAGEIQVRGPSVFVEYWRRPEATAASFTDGWFRTGDVAVREKGYYRILGRQSVDIIKSGGEKLSALEIEDALRLHPSVKEVAVVGVEDETWGEAVAAAVVTQDGAPLELNALRAWAKERISGPKIPKELKVVQDFPRNAMGKVMKPAVRDLFRRGEG